LQCTRTAITTFVCETGGEFLPGIQGTGKGAMRRAQQQLMDRPHAKA
jgi:hypothetical protein